MGTLSRAERDLAKGEGDQIEFKPFISSRDPKEGEIVDTAIAFANTAGGRIFVGVADRDASPQGIRGLLQAFRGEGADTALKKQVECLRWLISNKVAPAPRFSIEEIHVFGEPMVAITIESDDAQHYVLGTNDVWVRRGASNVRPRPGG
jgi:predicted HTH transcriptional regulator